MPAQTDGRHQNLLNRITQLIELDAGRFGQYQSLPPTVATHLPAQVAARYAQDQLNLDASRLDWLLEHLRPTSATEIGSNLGYFVLSLSDELKIDVDSFEPIEAYAEISQLFAKLAGLDRQVRCTCKSLTLDSLTELPEADLTINLNVLHHAGSAFDVSAVVDQGGWDEYARSYLRALSLKATHLFFQCGNMSNGEALFQGSRIVPHLAGLLEDAGWSVVQVGVVEDLATLQYTTYDADDIAAVPEIQCRRNGETGLVDYFRDGRIVASLPTGLAQRPLWLCRRHR